MKTVPVSFTHWYRRIMGNACPLPERRVHRFPFKVPQFRFGGILVMPTPLRADIAEIYDILDDITDGDPRRPDVVTQLDAMSRDKASASVATTKALLMVRVGSGSAGYLEMRADMFDPISYGEMSTVSLLLHGDIWIDITNHSDDNLDVAVSLCGWQTID